MKSPRSGTAAFLHRATLLCCCWSSGGVYALIAATVFIFFFFFGISMMEFWVLHQILQDLTCILLSPLLWDSVEYFNMAGPAPRLVCLLDIPGLRYINSCSDGNLTLGLWHRIPDHVDIQNILAHEKCLCPLQSDAGKDSSQGEFRIIWCKMKGWMLLLLFRLWIF